MRRCFFALGLACLALACTARPKGQSGVEPVPSAEAAEPPPHYHDYPEIPSDELGEPELATIADGGEAPDAAAVPAENCPTSEQPPPLARRPPRIASGPPVTNYIPPSIIMQPIRARAGCFRGCYQAGLARNPALTGRIATRFVIDMDGWVRRARIVSDELGDADVADCVRRAFIGLRYSEPEGGTVTVVYPLQFSPQP